MDICFFFLFHPLILLKVAAASLQMIKTSVGEV